MLIWPIIAFLTNQPASSPLLIERVCRTEDPICDVVELPSRESPGERAIAVITPAGYRVLDPAHEWKEVRTVTFSPEFARRAWGGFDPVDLDGDGTLEFVQQGRMGVKRVTVFNEDGTVQWSAQPPGG